MTLAQVWILSDDALIEELLVRLALGEDARPLSAEVLRRNIVDKATAAARARYAAERRRLDGVRA